MMQVKKRFAQTVLFMGLLVAGTNRTVLGAQVVPDQSAVVILDTVELRTIVGGQTLDGYAAADFAGGAFAAGAINQLNLAEAGWFEIAGTLGFGTYGMVVTANSITNAIWNDIGSPLAGDIATFFINSGWQLDQVPVVYIIVPGDWTYYSDATFSSETTADISDWYCGDIDCMCGDEEPDYPCNSGLWCGDDGYCHDSLPI